MTTFVGDITTPFTSTGIALLPNNKKFPQVTRVITTFVATASTVIDLQIGDPYTSTTLMKVIGVESGSSDAEATCTIVNNEITVVSAISTGGTDYIDGEEVIFVDPATTSNSARGTAVVIAGAIDSIAVTNGGKGGAIIEYRSINANIATNLTIVLSPIIGFNLQISSGALSYFAASTID